MAKPSNRVAPLCLTLVVCERVIQDAATGQATLLGLVTQVNAAGVPVQTGPLVAFLEFSSGHGTFPLVLRVVEGAEQVEPVYEHRMEVTVHHPLDTAVVTVPLPPLIFPDEGMYRVQVVDPSGGTLLERRLVVRLMEAQSR